MPSYRIELEIGRLRPGAVPVQVMDAARRACDGHHVDATDVAVTDGIPRILVRFSVPACSDLEEDVSARETAVRMRAAVAHVADVGRHRLLRRHHGSWLAVI